MGVVADDAVDDRHHAELLDATPQLAHRLLPGRDRRGPAVVEREHASHLPPDRRGFVAEPCAADELEGARLAFETLLPQPVLAPLHGVDGVEQIGARPLGTADDRPEVANRQSLDGWLGKEQESQRRACRLGEGLELLQSRPQLLPLPRVELRKARRQVEHVHPRPLDRPAQQLRLDLDAHHVRSSILWAI